MAFVAPSRPNGQRKKTPWAGEKKARSTICNSARGILTQNSIDLLIDACLSRNEADNDQVAQFFGMIAACVGGTGNPYYDALRGFGLLLDQPASFLSAISDTELRDGEIDICKKTFKAVCPDALGGEISTKMRELRSKMKRSDNQAKRAFWNEASKMVADAFGQEQTPFVAITYKAAPVAADNFAAAALAEVKGARFQSLGTQKGIAWDDDSNCFDWDPTKAPEMITAFDAIPHMLFPKAVGKFKGAWTLISSIVAGVEAKIKSDNLVSSVKKFTFEAREMSYSQSGVKFVNVAMEVIVEALMRAEKKETLLIGSTAIKYSLNGTLPRVPNVRGRNVVACYMLTRQCRPLRKVASMPDRWLDIIEDILGYIVYTKEADKVSDFLQTIMMAMKMKEKSGPRPRRDVDERIESLVEAAKKAGKQAQAGNVTGAAAQPAAGGAGGPVVTGGDVGKLSKAQKKKAKKAAQQLDD